MPNETFDAATGSPDLARVAFSKAEGGHDCREPERLLVVVVVTPVRIDICPVAGEHLHHVGVEPLLVGV
jgi:hypothetical protein